MDLPDCAEGQRDRNHRIAAGEVVKSLDSPVPGMLIGHGGFLIALHACIMRENEVIVNVCQLADMSENAWYDDPLSAR